MLKVNYDDPVIQPCSKSKCVFTFQYQLLKICDFGIAREDAHTMTAGQGSSLWMAPELKKVKSYRDTDVQMY